MGYTFRTIKTLPYIKKKVRELIEDYEKPRRSGSIPRLLCDIHYSSSYDGEGGTLSMNHCQITIPGEVFQNEVYPAMKRIQEGTSRQYGMGDGPGWYSSQDEQKINTRLKEWAGSVDRKTKIKNVLAEI